MRWLRGLYDWVLSWADRPGGSVALGAISFAESSFFPIPPDPLLCAMCLGKRERSLFFATLTTLTSVAGGVFGWLIGAYFFDDVVLWFVELLSLQESWLGTAGSISAEHAALTLGNTTMYPDGYLYKAQLVFDEWGFFAMFAAALSPLPYKVATIASGVFALPLHIVVIGSLLGRGLRFYTEGVLLFFFADRAKEFIDKHFALVTTLALVLFFVGIYAIKYVL